jgi:hypothetical protein
MADFVAYRDIACVYPISGQYNNLPRWLYYFLLISVIVLRRQHWLAVGAAATCLTYGGGAAIHALILTHLRQSLVSQIPDGYVQLPSGQELWISAAALDLDTDGTLAIIGVGFLITLPMALWSSQFRRSDAKPILVIWTVLMFLGMVCCLVNLYGVDTTIGGPYRQYRFCHASNNDSFPVTGGGIVASLKGDWNSTIWTHFSTGNSTFRECVYPCFNTGEILRSQDQITAIPFPEISPSNPQYWGVGITAALVYVCVPLTILFSLALLILNIGGFSVPSWDFALRIKDKAEGRYKLAFRILAWVINAYAKILTPLILVVFVIWVEWTITLDIQSETYRDVGQWTPVVYFGLVVISAFIGRFWKAYRWWRRESENTLQGSLLESLHGIWEACRNPPTEEI